MAWSIGHLPISEYKSIDRFLLACGKALYVANGFEMKCRSFLRVANLADLLEDGRDIDSAILICNAIKDKMLNATLSEIREYHIDENDADALILEAAKNARNFIAHEVAWLGPLFSISSTTLESRISALANAVSDLALGDNLVSGWLYELEEREPAPRTIHNEYPKWIQKWIFGAETK